MESEDNGHAAEYGLECLRCGVAQRSIQDAYLCEICGPGGGPMDAGVLDVRYDLVRARRALFAGRDVRSDRRDVFRYRPLLPVATRTALLEAGGTPLVRADRLAADLGLAALHLKDETRNPTRALKDRATEIGVTRAVERGYRDIACASAGNAAISLAAFAAGAGLRAHAFVPNDTSNVRLAWLERLGADIRRSDGDYDQAYGEAEARRADGWYSRNCAFNPFLVEGKKTAALEIAEQLGWDVPDLVVCPVGDACTLAGIGKGFRELSEMGVTNRLPRLIGVQAAAVRPLVDAFHAQRSQEQPEPPVEQRTGAASIAVRHPRNARRLLQELELADGMLLAVDEAAIASAQRELAKGAGVVAEFSSAAALAGLRHLAELEPLGGRRVVLMITGGRLDDE